MDIMMSPKEAQRAQVIELLTAGKIDPKEAGKRLAVSVRQIKRIVRRYRATGLPGPISQKRGQLLDNFYHKPGQMHSPSSQSLIEGGKR